jgi:hypothetical protein
MEKDLSTAVPDVGNDLSLFFYRIKLLMRGAIPFCDPSTIESTQHCKKNKHNI